MNKILPLLIISTFFILLSCETKEREKDELAEDTVSFDTLQIHQSQPQWYYFSQSGIHKVQLPTDIPSRPFTPWTEAIRVVQTNSIEGKQVFLINKLGIVSLNSDNSALYSHPEYFKSMSVGGIYRTEEGYVMRMYRNSFFTSVVTQMPFLLHFDSETKLFSPLLSSLDFGFSSTAQGVALDRVGSMWYAAFKEEKDSQVFFTYIEFEKFPKSSSESTLLDLSGIRKISSESYQNAIAPFSIESAPEQLTHMLSHISSDTSWTITVSSPRFRSTQVFSNNPQESTVTGSAWVSDAFSSVIFEDGTVFLLNGTQDATKTLTLPTLAQGYIYTAAIVSANTIIASWEETRFFETGRAGLLEIRLPDGLY